ncbi:MAG: potassium channel protein [Marinilabiliales bacterium]|nr:MAG: potassium channel protein [Marinilabiliales bacterium]
MLKNKTLKLVEKGSHGSKINSVYDIFIMVLILLNIVAIILETIPEIYDSYKNTLHIFEIVSVIIFSIEYLLRIYVSDITHPSSSRFKSALKFIFSIYGIIDLLAILPFYLPVVFKIDLRFIRILRFARFIRILKINRYNKSLSLICTVIKEKKSELTITGFVTFLILLIASFIMYFVEKDAQPDAFPNILAAFWWAVATLTTVGYGDIYPITGIGKVISGIIAILGIGLVALHTGIVSAGFIEKIGKDKKEKKTCPHCGEEID